MTADQWCLIDDLLSEAPPTGCEPIMIGPKTWAAIRAMRDDWTTMMRHADIMRHAVPAMTQGSTQ